MEELIGDILRGLLLAAALVSAFVVLPFYTIRGLWRLCRSIDLDLLLRGWECNVPAWQVPILFLGFVIVPLITQGPILALLIPSFVLRMIAPHSVK